MVYALFYALMSCAKKINVTIGWGDGRVVGGKKSTIITISPIGDNLVLHSREVLPLHSLASAIPVCIYDGRKSLGDNEFMCPLRRMQSEQSSPLCFGREGSCNVASP